MAFGDHEDEDIPVRSPVDTKVEVAPTALPRDEEDYSTIVELLKIIEEAEGGCGDVLAVDLKHPKLSAEQQIAAMQYALTEFILPAKALMISRINDVEEQRRERFNGQ